MKVPPPTGTISPASFAAPNKTDPGRMSNAIATNVGSTGMELTKLLSYAMTGILQVILVANLALCQIGAA